MGWTQSVSPVAQAGVMTTWEKPQWTSVACQSWDRESPNHWLGFLVLWVFLGGSGDTPRYTQGQFLAQCSEDRLSARNQAGIGGKQAEHFYPGLSLAPKTVFLFN